MVMGPTPPGTGVMAFAFLLTSSKSTSPQRPLSVRLMPTSMTTAPSFTISAVMNFGLPMAAKTKSASRHTWARLAVLEWHTVTVALPNFPGRMRREAKGFPTMLDLPTTTARLPSVGKS